MPRGARYKGRRIMAGTFAAVIHAFKDSPKYLALATSTKTSYAYALKMAEIALGAKPIEEMRPALVQAFLDGFADRPAQQKCAQTALKSLEKWAIVRDKLATPIMLGTEAPGGTGGHEPWTDADVQLAEQKARTDHARLITLAANTGQRGSDLVKMRWSHIEEYEGRLGINVTQVKTGVVIWIPLTIELAAALKTWERRLPDYLILKPDGMPWSRSQLSDSWLRQRSTNPALEPLRARGLSFHGLRATAVIRLRRAGATTGQIASMVGMSEPMVNRYCRLSVQRENAMAAVHFLDGTPREPAQVVPFKSNA